MRLQPHFPSVWEYCAWNMAWNISVTTFTPEERWNWVYNGVKLLRDQGIPLNPRAVNLYKQLAWIFNNKMSEPTDDQHYAYKCNWGWRMHILLGPPPDPLAGLDVPELANAISSTEQLDRLAEAGRRTFEQNLEKERSAEPRGEEFKPRALPAETPDKSAAPAQLSEYEVAQRAALERVRQINDAPPTVAELVAHYPETRRMAADLLALGIDVNEEPNEDVYWRQEGLAFTFFLPYRALVTPGSTLSRVARQQNTTYVQRARMEDLDRILGVRAGNAAGQALVHCLQRRVLREVYKLEPADMLELVQEFGPMDWRAVDAQGLYWATRGLVAAGETISQYGNDKTNTARIIFFCLRNLFLRGHMVFEPDPDNINRSYLSLSRDLNFIEPMHEAYVRYGPLFDPEVSAGSGAGETYRSGHVNFLTEAIRLLYLAGRDTEASRYYSYLRATYQTTPAGTPNRAFTKSLHDFVMSSFLESVESEPGMRDVMLLIDGWLINAYNQLADGDTNSYVRYVDAAREYHKKYMEDKRGDPGWANRYLPEFLDLQVDALGAWLARPPVSSATTLHKARLWQNAPVYLRQAVYDTLLPGLQAECDHWNFDVSKAFPEPKGLDEYRKQHPERYKPGAEPQPEAEPPPAS